MIFLENITVSKSKFYQVVSDLLNYLYLFVITPSPTCIQFITVYCLLYYDIFYTVFQNFQIIVINIMWVGGETITNKFQTI